MTMNVAALRRVLLLGLVPVLMTGCAQQLTRIETRVDEVGRVQDQTSRKQDVLAADVEQVRSLLEDTGISGDERRAALQSQIQNLERAVTRLTAQAEEQQQLLRRISASLALLQEMPSGRVPPGASNDPPPRTDSASNAAPSSGSASTGAEVFDAAFADFSRGSYSLARAGFQEMLQRFPRSDLADDATYWIAETHYAQASYDEALSGFESVLQRYPRGDTLAPALLKMGYCMLELKDETRARATFERLKQEYPDSEEALIAEHKLTSM